jgi:hypothetical protein
MLPHWPLTASTSQLSSAHTAKPHHAPQPYSPAAQSCAKGECFDTSPYSARRRRPHPSTSTGRIQPRVTRVRRPLFGRADQWGRQNLRCLKHKVRMNARLNHHVVGPTGQPYRTTAKRADSVRVISAVELVKQTGQRHKAEPEADKHQPPPVDGSEDNGYEGQ